MLEIIRGGSPETSIPKVPAVHPAVPSAKVNVCMRVHACAQKITLRGPQLIVFDSLKRKST